MYTVLDVTEYCRICTLFEERHPFNPGYFSSEGFSGTRPYITISLKSLSGKQSEQLYAIEKDLPSILGYPMYAIDWYHACYRVDSPEDLTDVPISIYPDGDYIIVIDSNAENGTYGNPHYETICFFGKKVVDAFENRITETFSVLRLDV